MDAPVTVTPKELPSILLDVAVVRPVFIWGQPGIGKSSLVEAFAVSLGMKCVSLLGSQLAPEDLIGVPRIEDGVSRFCPPSIIARNEPYVLFLDELNASSVEVQKSCYSLILEQRIGEYKMPEGSVVIGAGNRAQDSAIVRAMSSALVNRMVHLHLNASVKDWIEWASANNIHPWVLEYIRTRPDHLSSAAPKIEEPFSTPRSWHMLSDILHSTGSSISESTLKALALGTLSPVHANQFSAFVRQIQHSYDLDAILKGDLRWPAAPEQRDILYFLAQSLRARLIKALPDDKRGLNSNTKELSHRAKGLLKNLSDISVEIAQLVVAPGGHDGDGSGDESLPAWFLTEVVRDLPRLAKARDA